MRPKGVRSANVKNKRVSDEIISAKLAIGECPKGEEHHEVRDLM